MIQRRKLEVEKRNHVQSPWADSHRLPQKYRNSLTTKLAVELPCIDAMIVSSWVGCRFNLSLVESEPLVVK